MISGERRLKIFSGFKKYYGKPQFQTKAEINEGYIKIFCFINL